MSANYSTSWTSDVAIEKGWGAMKLVLDCHVHTYASGHAYSTVKEYMDAAVEKGLALIGFSDHGPAMPGGPHPFHHGNQQVIPRHYKGVILLRGAELNIIDFEGKIDLDERILKRLDYCIAGFHDVCLEPGSQAQNTEALIKAMQNPYVDILAHTGNPRWPVDREAVIEAAAATGKIIEINNSSFTNLGRKGSRDNCYQIAELACRHNVRMIASSDCHIAFDLGKFDYAVKLFKEVGVPETLIMNTEASKWLGYLAEKGKVKDLTEQPV